MGSPYTWTSFTKTLVFHSCMALLSALDLTNTNASWETVSLVLGGSSTPPPLQLLSINSIGPPPRLHPAILDPVCLHPQRVLGWDLNLISLNLITIIRVLPQSLGSRCSGEIQTLGALDSHPCVGVLGGKDKPQCWRPTQHLPLLRTGVTDVSSGATGLDNTLSLHCPL